MIEKRDAEQRKQKAESSTTRLTLCFPPFMQSELSGTVDWTVDDLELHLQQGYQTLRLASYPWNTSHQTTVTLAFILVLLMNCLYQNYGKMLEQC